MISRRRFLTGAAIALAPMRAPAHAQEYKAQQAGKVSRVGFLRFGSIPPALIEGFRQGLRERGYVEGQNIVIEYGLAQTTAQLPDVAADLVRLKVDVLVASGVPSVLPAKNATSTIPVVFVSAIAKALPGGAPGACDQSGRGPVRAGGRACRANLGNAAASPNRA